MGDVEEIVEKTDVAEEEITVSAKEMASDESAQQGDDVSTAADASENGDNESSGDAPAKKPKRDWAVFASIAIGFMALTIGVVGVSSSKKREENLREELADMSRWCKYQEVRLANLEGRPLEVRDAAWAQGYYRIDLEHEFISQVRTSVGYVNVVRTRPTTAHDNNLLNFRVTNPNSMTLNAGKLIVRYGSEFHNAVEDRQQDDNIAWQRSLHTKTIELPELRGGETRSVQVRLEEEEEIEFKHVDFQIHFEYFTPNKTVL